MEEHKTLREKLVHLFIIGIFVSLYFLVATISMINSVAFFDLSHSGLMSWSLAIGFEIGAAASLAAIIILDKTNKTMVWGLFLLLTSFQMMANSYHAFSNLEDYMGWIELFGLEEEEPIFQKRILSIVSGAILPLVALGFIKSLVDYIRPEQPEVIPTDPLKEETIKVPPSYDENEERMNIIGQNGNDGIHYDEIETPIAGSAEPIIEEIIPAEGEELPEEDLYSRDANKATIPTEIGEVIIAPETVNIDTDNADANKSEKPVTAEHIITNEPVKPVTVNTPVYTPPPSPPRNIEVTRVLRGLQHRSSGESKP